MAPYTEQQLPERMHPGNYMSTARHEDRTASLAHSLDSLLACSDPQSRLLWRGSGQQLSYCLLL